MLVLLRLEVLSLIDLGVFLGVRWVVRFWRVDYYFCVIFFIRYFWGYLEYYIDGFGYIFYLVFIVLDVREKFNS